MSTWRLGSLLFLSGLRIGLGLGYTIGSRLPIASAQGDETVRLLHSIDERLRQISHNGEKTLTACGRANKCQP